MMPRRALFLAVVATLTAHVPPLVFGAIEPGYGSLRERPGSSGCSSPRGAPRHLSSRYQRVVRPTPSMRPCMMLFGARNDALSALVVT